MLVDLGVRKVRLMTNNPLKAIGWSRPELEIIERLSIEIQANRNNQHYLWTKKQKMGRIFSMDRDSNCRKDA